MVAIATDQEKVEKRLEKISSYKMPVVHAQAILMLAQGHSQTKVAEALGVHANTIWRWMQKNEFAELVAHSRSVMFEGMLNYVNDHSVEVVQVLFSIANAPPARRVSERDKVAAASKLIDIQFRGKQLELEAVIEDMQLQIQQLTQEIKELREGGTQQQTIEAKAIETTPIYD